MKNSFGLSDQSDAFVPRHLGPSEAEQAAMLKVLGLSSLDELIDRTVPKPIRIKSPLAIPAGRSESKALSDLRKIAGENQVFRSFIGLGYSECITPPVIQRNILENPGWYTQYTPYQAEISQGRLEALLNFQTLIMDLTAMPVSNASMLDEGTAAAEAMTMAFGIKGRDTQKSFFVSEGCHPQTLEVIRTRAEPLGIKVVVGNHLTWDFKTPLFGALVQYPDTLGTVHDYRDFIRKMHESDALVVMAADILSLALLVPPGELGADIAVGSTQRLGVPLGFGGPHAAYFSTRDEFKRQMPGRIVGASKDVDGKNAIRLALQTREQHIRRDKATSNICTSQVLLAVIASMYAVYHGPEGLRQIAKEVLYKNRVLRNGLKRLGFEMVPGQTFDTTTVLASGPLREKIIQGAKALKMNFCVQDVRNLGISLGETASAKDLEEILSVFATAVGKKADFSLADLCSGVTADPEKGMARTSPFMTHPVFNRYHSETEMLRYLRRLESKDLSLTSSMIPLGSCTMKLNATAEMFPISWPEFASLHPFAPAEQTQGYQNLFRDFEKMLAEITGFDGISLQPNAGSQGEYAGLLTIRKFHQSKGDAHRDVCLIPKSAHGTNPASAVMAGMRVVVVECDSQGNVDLSDLRAKASENSRNLSALMVTYPSTHGVFEEGIIEICRIVHEHGGQVYMDGANMNAQVGLCRPGDFGPDVCHLNLHKTFCIPHGGGGPGMGPIGVKKHLLPFLPQHPLQVKNAHGGGPVSAAPWGSASILPISWMYIAMMGGEGLKKATQVAILNANYIAKRLEPHYPVLYKGKSGTVAHECIFDLRPLKDRTGIDVEDVAKRLMDYGFHAPTVSFPVAGTLMVEPTESESLQELDRFCEAMILIRKEFEEVETGKLDRTNNPLKNAPHTAEQVTRTEWNRPYSRERAAFPYAASRTFKFWPAVGRINNVLGDRNLICGCPPIEDYT